MGCILVDGAEVGGNAKLERCMVARKAMVERKCLLKNFEMMNGLEVVDGSKCFYIPGRWCWVGLRMHADFGV